MKTKFNNFISRLVIPKFTDRNVKYKERTIRVVSLSFFILSSVSLIFEVIIFPSPDKFQLFSYPVILSTCFLVSLLVIVNINKGRTRLASYMMVGLMFYSTLSVILTDAQPSLLAIPSMMITAIIIITLLPANQALRVIAVLWLMSSVANYSRIALEFPASLDYMEQTLININSFFILSISYFFLISLKKEFELVTAEINKNMISVEEKLQFSRQRYKAIVEGQTELIFRSKLDGTITFANSAFYKFTKTNPSQIINNKFNFELADFDKAMLESYFISFSYQNPLATITHKVIDDEGKVHWLERTDRAIFDKNKKIVEFQTVAKDITDKKKAEIELFASEERFRTLANTMPALVWSVNEMGEITYLNDRWEEFLGEKVYSMQDVNNFVHPDDLKNMPILMAEYFRIQTSFEFDVRIKNKRGNYNWILIRGVPQTDTANQFRGFVGACIDITMQKQLVQNLLQEKATSEKVIKLKEILLADVSHEIRTPLNIIVGMSDFLDKTQLDAEQRNYINSIKLSSRNLLSIVEDVLSLSKLESGKFDLNWEPVNIRNFMSEFMTSIKQMGTNKGLNVRLRIDENISDYLFIDKVKLGQILLNLASNSIKFTPSGFIEIALDLKAKEKDHNIIEFKVKDSGIGISKKNIGKIFESFIQIDQSKNTFGGTGLGLTITKKVLELYNSEIKVTSTLGKGSIFSFELKLKTSNSKEVRKFKKEKYEQLDTGVLKGLKVLVVEDDLLNRNMISKILKDLKMIVKLVPNERLALRALLKEKFDLILMDLRLGDTDGFELTSMIRKELNIDVPIIGVSANAYENIKDKFESSLMNGYISKPFRAEALAEVMLENIFKEVPGFEIFSNNYFDGSNESDREFLINTLNIMSNQLKLDLLVINDSVKTSDYAKIAEIMHRLKSSVGFLKLNAIRSAAIELEKLVVTSSDKKLIRKKVKNFNELCQKFELERESLVKA